MIKFNCYEKLIFILLEIRISQKYDHLLKWFGQNLNSFTQGPIYFYNILTLTHTYFLNSKK